MSIRNDLFKVSFLSLAALALLPGMALAMDFGNASVENLKGLYPGKAYSPYAQIGRAHV